MRIAEPRIFARSARTQIAFQVEHTDLPIAKPRNLARSARIHFAFFIEHPLACEIVGSTIDQMPGEASRTGVSGQLPGRGTIELARLAMVVFHRAGFFGF